MLLRAGLLASVLLGACRPASEHKAPQPAAARVSSERIDLELTDADIYLALGMLAKNARISLFADSDLTGQVTLQVHATAWSEVLAKLARDHALRIEQLDVQLANGRPALWISNQASPPAPVTRFTGQPIEFRFDETPIRDAARTLSELAKVSIAVDDDVHASITLHGRHIPWDLALYHLAQKYELRIVRSGDSFRIARR